MLARILNSRSHESCDTLNTIKLSDEIIDLIHLLRLKHRFIFFLLG